MSKTPWSPHQGAGSTTYSPGPPTNTSYGSPSSSGGTIGGTGNNYDDVRAELKAMMDNPSWDDGVSAAICLHVESAIQYNILVYIFS